MKVLMRENSAGPDKVLIRGKVYDLPSAEANEFIELDAAEKIKDADIKSYHEPPSTTPRET